MSDNNEEKKSYSFQFNPNDKKEENDYQENDELANSDYLNGRQVNYGKSLVKSLNGKSSVRYPYGIRGESGSVGKFNGYWKRGAISVLGIAIILGILAFIIMIFVK